MAHDEVRLASAGQPEGEDVVAALDEGAFAERRQDLRDLRRQARLRFERGERLLGGQVASRAEVALDAAAAALLDFELGEVVEVLPEGPAFALGLRARSPRRSARTSAA